MTVLCLKAAAVYLAMHPETLRRLAVSGRIPCKRIGLGLKQPRYKFLKEKLDQFMNDDLPFVDPRNMKIMKQPTKGGEI